MKILHWHKCSARRSDIYSDPRNLFAETRIGKRVCQLPKNLVAPRLVRFCVARRIRCVETHQVVSALVKLERSQGIGHLTHVGIVVIYAGNQGKVNGDWGTRLTLPLLETVQGHNRVHGVGQQFLSYAPVEAVERVVDAHIRQVRRKKLAQALRLNGLGHDGRNVDPHLQAMTCTRVLPTLVHGRKVFLQVFIEQRLSAGHKVDVEPLSMRRLVLLIDLGVLVKQHAQLVVKSLPSDALETGLLAFGQVAHAACHEAAIVARKVTRRVVPVWTQHESGFDQTTPMRFGKIHRSIQARFVPRPNFLHC